MKMRHVRQVLVTFWMVLANLGVWAQQADISLEYSGNWMGRIPDNTFVAAISIPGSHDSSTGSGWASGYEELGEMFARTQDLTFAEQWSIGIRAFDMRPCVHQDHLNLNHGICATILRFDEVLFQLRDSLIANPSEFIIIHLNHETDGDLVSDPNRAIYNARIQELLKSDELKDYMVDFKRTLRLSDVRGKILVLSRDKYASQPVGGFLNNWTGSADWSRRTQVTVTGPGSSSSRTSSIYIQDYWETYEPGTMDIKLNALLELLRYGSTHKNRVASSVVWYLNFASAYSKVGVFNASLSEGYRDNATYTNKAIVEYLADESHMAGPTGIILMDYVGVDESAGYATMGASAVKAIIANNFKYLEDMGQTSVGQPDSAVKRTLIGTYSITGMKLSTPQPGSICIFRYSDGTCQKVMF
ncbi:MAG: hypothetical protein IKO71_06000 [Bacteroidaceae bacterium]|nr:hypothetical protein [Bacteroidaceae bacterium]